MTKHVPKKIVKSREAQKGDTRSRARRAAASDAKRKGREGAEPPTYLYPFRWLESPMPAPSPLPHFSQPTSIVGARGMHPLVVAHQPNVSRVWIRFSKMRTTEFS